MRRVFLIIVMALGGLIPLRVAAQESGRFETEIAGTVGAFQHYNLYASWGASAQVSVRQSLFSVAFIEAEWSAVNAKYPAFAPFLPAPPPNAPGHTHRRRYISVGGGVQFPGSVVRPYTGFGFGRMMPDAGWGTQVARTLYSGVAFRLASRIRSRIEYRLRWELEGQNGFQQSQQWLAGVAMRLRG